MNLHNELLFTRLYTIVRIITSMSRQAESHVNPNLAKAVIHIIRLRILWGSCLPPTALRDLHGAPLPGEFARFSRA